MPITIGSNIASLKTQRQLGKASDSLSAVYERLSSGQRINKASDDAAGLAIASSLNASTRVYTQGVRNFSDGQSLLSIADGAVTELSGVVLRIRELTTQAANGTYTAKQRQALDQEAQALAKEYNRVARTTEFNGRKIFDSDFGSLQLQGGFGAQAMVSSGLGGAIGTGTFGAGQLVTVGAGVGSVAVGDFNGDGIDDIVNTNQTDSNLTVLINQGNGTFTVSQTVANGNSLRYVLVSDFNGDGISDFATADQQPESTMSIYISNGNGTFKSRVSYATSGRIWSVTAGDFNGDGIQDTAVTDVDNGYVNVFRGNSDGTFGARQTYSIGVATHAEDIMSGDINGDGIIDIITADSLTDTISMLIGRGDGSFTVAGSLATDDAPSGLRIADFNNDGIADIISDDRNNPGNISIFLGTGSGNFSARRTYAIAGGPHITIADFNGDGNIDIAGVIENPGGMSVILGNGDGSFSSPTTYPPSAGAYGFFIASGDFNNDGVKDIVNTNYFAGSLEIYLGNKADGISALQPFSLKSRYDALQTMPYIDSVLNRLNIQRGTIGAFQSRLTVATNNLTTTITAYEGARSRILDADIAEESSKLVRTQILQQAGASVLSQANLQPQIALKLLQQ